MDNYRNLSIVVTMLVIFTLSFTYIYWHGSTELPKSAPQPAVVAMDTGPIMPSVSPVANSPRPAPARQPQTPTRAIQLAQSEAPSPTEARPSEGVPVLVTLLNPGEGSIRNQQDEELAVTISEVNSHSGPVSQIQMTLGPSERRKFTVNDGLPMQSSDHIIVHAAGFIDQESQIP